VSTVARPTQILQPLRDEDAVIATRNFRDDWFFIQAGNRLPADNWLVRQMPEAFAPVTRAVPRSRALKTLSPFYQGERIVLFPGQWVDRDDPRVIDHPTLFEPLEPA
jgi:hypothetical protein